MKVRLLNEWDTSPAEAIRIQERLAPLVSHRDELSEVRLLAGIDVGLRGSSALAAVAVLSYPELELVEVSRAAAPLRFPYVPGLLSFREAPAALDACEGLRSEPDLLIVDGQGVAHPRRLGIASHLGLCLDVPTIGCAKSLLVGRHEPVGEQVGDSSEIVDRGEIVGLALRTKRGVKPVYVSIGHRVDLDSAAQWVLSCCRRYRLPEPQRQAHLAASGSRS